MCGRLNVIDDPLVDWLMEELGIEFSTSTNRDLRPTQEVATVASVEGDLQQLNTVWGIQPRWAQKLIINAQAETVATKPTFRDAFTERRCVVPCSGFYEWRDEGGPRKQKYLFSAENGRPLYMAGIWYPGEAPELVTLTMDAPDEFREYHHRFPVFIPLEGVRDWVLSSPENAGAWVTDKGGRGIVVQKAVG